MYCLSVVISWFSSRLRIYAGVLLLGLCIVGVVWVGRVLSSTSNAKIDLTLARHEFEQKEQSDGQMRAESSSDEDPLVRLSDIDKPKILVFWTLGCIPCLKFLIVCNKLTSLFQEKGVEIMPVLISHNSDQPVVFWGHAVVYLARLIQKNTFSQPSWKALFPNLTPYYDAKGVFFSTFKIMGTPFIVFLDRKNRVIEQREGFQNWQDPAERAKLDALLQKMKG